MAITGGQSLAGQGIEDLSFKIVDSLLPPLSFSYQERQVVIRLIHASGDLSLAAEVLFHPGAIEAGLDALKKGCSIYTDVRMVYTGVDSLRAKSLGCKVYCALAEIQKQPKSNETRVGAAILSLSSRLDGSLVAIGNAPTALLSLVEMIDAGIAKPALVIGMPVGFVSCKESKEELLKRNVPHIIVKGSRGGSPLAAATVNALLRLALSSNQDK